LDHQKVNPSLDGAEEPFWVFLSCFQILRAVKDQRAQAILETAYHQLQDRAAQLTDADLQRSFLENVPAHWEIVREYEKRVG
jgi:hypothetical protein